MQPDLSPYTSPPLGPKLCAFAAHRHVYPLSGFAFLHSLTVMLLFPSFCVIIGYLLFWRCFDCLQATPGRCSGTSNNAALPKAASLVSHQTLMMIPAGSFPKTMKRDASSHAVFQLRKCVLSLNSSKRRDSLICLIRTSFLSDTPPGTADHSKHGVCFYGFFGAFSSRFWSPPRPPSLRSG